MTHVYVKIDLFCVQNEALENKENYFQWSASSNGIKYELKFEFAALVDVRSFQRHNSFLPEFSWKKVEPLFWSHLLKDPTKYDFKCHLDYVEWKDKEEQEDRQSESNQSKAMTMHEWLEQFKRPGRKRPRLDYNSPIIV